MGAEAAPPLLNPLGEIGQRIAGAQLQDALEFKGLVQNLYPDQDDPMWTYGCHPVSFTPNGYIYTNQRYCVPWLVSRTLEVTGLGTLPNYTALTPALDTNVYVSIYAAHPQTLYPDGTPLREVVTPYLAAGFPIHATQTFDPLVIDPGLWWLSLTSAGNVIGMGAQYLPIGVASRALNAVDFAAFASWGAGCLRFSGPAYGGPGMNLTGATLLQMSDTTAYPLVQMRPV